MPSLSVTSPFQKPQHLSWSSRQDLPCSPLFFSAKSSTNIIQDLTNTQTSPANHYPNLNTHTQINLSPSRQDMALTLGKELNARRSNYQHPG